MIQQRGKHMDAGRHNSSHVTSATLASNLRDNHPLRLAIELTLAFFWVVFLKDTTAVYSCYVLVFAIAALNVPRVQHMRSDERLTSKRKLVLRLLSGFISCLITMANYACIYGSTKMFVGRLFYALMLLGSGYVVWDIITTCAFIDSYRLDDWVNRHQPNKTLRGWQVFAATFAFLAGVYLLYLFLVAYPGNVAYDSFTQLRQILSGNYDNHHPYYSTQLIHLFFGLGMTLFGDVNAAVATYSVAQCLAVAAVYAYAVETLYEASCPRAFLVVLVLSLGLVPYQYMYSVVMWKDIPFSMGGLLFLTALWRSDGAFAHPRINLVLLFLGTISFVVMRNNGIYAFLVFLLAAVLFLVRRHAFRRFALVIGVVLAGFVLSIVMKYPLLRVLGVPETEGVMNLAVPAQQIARVVKDDAGITDEERALIEAIAPIDEIKKAYNPNHYKAIKTLMMGDSFEPARKNRNAYIMLWIQLGLRHPAEYIKAWSDLTAHYWNAGYDYQYGGIGIDGHRVSPNKIGVKASVNVEWLDKIATYLSKGMKRGQFLGLLICVGLYTWFFLVLFAVNVLRGKGAWLLVVLPLAVILTLAIASPVLSDFRYAYTTFTTIGFITAASFVPKSLDSSTSVESRIP